MKAIKRVLKPAIVLVATIPPVWAGGPPDRAAPDIMAQAVTGRLLRYDRPPVPPADIPNVGSTPNMGPTRYNASTRRFPLLPLPRARPGDLAAGVARKTHPETQPEPHAAAVPEGSGVVPAATPPAMPTMVPVAPLE